MTREPFTFGFHKIEYRIPITPRICAFKINTLAGKCVVYLDGVRYVRLRANGDRWVRSWLR